VEGVGIVEGEAEATVEGVVGEAKPMPEPLVSRPPSPAAIVAALFLRKGGTYFCRVVVGDACPTLKLKGSSVDVAVSAEVFLLVGEGSDSWRWKPAADKFDSDPAGVIKDSAPFRHHSPSLPLKNVGASPTRPEASRTGGRSSCSAAVMAC
jgi:hypothetical protein